MSFSDVRGGALGDGSFDDDPRFVPGPAGCYYLSQEASGQTAESPCVDRGSGPVEPLNVGNGTTRSDEEPDAGIVDLGFHYPVTGRTTTFGDVDRNDMLDLLDVAGLQNCFIVGSGDLSPCCRVFDIEPDNDVDLIDYAAFEVVFSASDLAPSN